MKRFLLLISFLAIVKIFAQQLTGSPLEARQQIKTNSLIEIAKSYLETPYAAHTLDKWEHEKLTIRTDSVDCVTFVEYVLAQAFSSSFEENLKKIRYRNGIIDGYTSRLHYISDWIENGIYMKFIQDITAIHSSDSVMLSLSYMSSHPQLYRQLSESHSNIQKIIEYERRLTGKSVYILPKSKLPSTGLPWINDGDIIAITSNQKGLDITHIGFAYYINGYLHLLHASSSLGKVAVSTHPLTYMLKKNKSWSGIRVMRILNNE